VRKRLEALEQYQKLIKAWHVSRIHR